MAAVSLAALVQGCVAETGDHYGEALGEQTDSLRSKPFDAFDVEGKDKPPWRNGLLLAKVCAVADSPADERKTTLDELGLTEYAFIDGSRDSQALVVGNTELIVVAAPGTHSFRDGIRDLQVRYVKPWSEEFEVHNGFYVNEQAVEERVITAIDKARLHDRIRLRPARKIWITGHSQGGATMTLLAYRLKRLGYPVTGVTSYGAPKSGDAGFRDAYQDERGADLGDVTHRWINEYDPVPSVPARDSYKHVGQQHFIEWSEDRVIFYDSEAREYNLLIRGFRNHGIADYIDQIEKIWL